MYFFKETPQLFCSPGKELMHITSNNIIYHCEATVVPPTSKMSETLRSRWLSQAICDAGDDIRLIPI